MHDTLTFRTVKQAFKFKSMFLIRKIYIANQLGLKKRIAGQEPSSSFDLDDFDEVTSIRYSLHSEALGWIVCFLSCVGWSEDAGYAAGTDEQA